jgi:hypothetical protein
MHQLEVVMKATTTDERALLRPHDFRHARRQAGIEDLGHQLRPTMNQANGPKILNLNRVIMLWREGNQGQGCRM